MSRLSAKPSTPTNGRAWLPVAGLVCAAAILLAVVPVGAEPPPRPTPGRGDSSMLAQPPGGGRSPVVQRANGERRDTAALDRQASTGPFREGMELVDQPGTFKLAGDRAIFFVGDGKQQLIGLENLNLERIVHVITDNPESLEWFVTGAISEYRGSNYLLVRRVTFKNRSPGVHPAATVPPESQRGENALKSRNPAGS